MSTSSTPAEKTTKGSANDTVWSANVKSAVNGELAVAVVWAVASTGDDLGHLGNAGNVADHAHRVGRSAGEVGIDRLLLILKRIVLWVVVWAGDWEAKRGDHQKKEIGETGIVTVTASEDVLSLGIVTVNVVNVNERGVSVASVNAALNDWNLSKPTMVVKFVLRKNLLTTIPSILNIHLRLTTIPMLNTKMMNRSMNPPKNTSSQIRMAVGLL